MQPRPFANNPGFLDDERLRSSFVVRGADLSLLVELLQEQGDGPNQHVLVVGAPGMGKTTLMRRLVAEIDRDASLASMWRPIVLGEEIPAVLSVGELWLEAIRRLALTEDDARWRAIHEELAAERDERRLRERALDHLRSFAQQRGARLLLVIENMNELLGEQLSDDEAWILRHTLLNEPDLMVIGTATTRFEAIDNVEKAMFDLFKIHQLDPLDAEECRALYQAFTGTYLRGRRVRPLQVWTRGNPRRILLMADVRMGAQPGLREALQHLVDEQTPTFKANLEALPVVERKIYISLAELWEWASARQVAARARIAVNKASAYLGRLESRGAVESRTEGRAKRYRVSERLFVLYHLMRHRGAQARRLRGLIEFMEGFYEPGSALEHRVVRLARGGPLEQVVAEIEASDDAEMLEPLVVALELRAGQDVDVPAEVYEVARDVGAYLDEASAGSD